MAFENVRLEKKNHIAYVTIDRPKVLNALNMATMGELEEVFTDLAADRDTRVVILTGGGEKAFVAGADINELAKNNAVEAKAYTHRGQAVLDLIENLGKPVIACVNGFALGGGCEIAMACTMRLASETAKFGQPEVKLGIIPGYGGTQRLPRLVGKGLAMQLVLTGEMISAQEAHRIGLVNEVVPADKLIPRAEEIAGKIIGMSPLAIQYCMEAVNEGMNMTLQEGLFLEATLLQFAARRKIRMKAPGRFWKSVRQSFRANRESLRIINLCLTKSSHYGLIATCRSLDCTREVAGRRCGEFSCRREYRPGMDWFWSNLIGGVKLQVAAQDAEAVLAILGEEIPAGFTAEEVWWRITSNQPAPSADRWTWVALPVP